MKYSPILLVTAILMYGCGSTTDRQAHRTQVETLMVPAIQLESPAGTFITQPVTIRRKVEEVKEETEKKTVDLPDPAPLMQAALGGTPWGGIISGVIGLGTAAFAAKKAVDNGRQRDELADGIESAKDHIDAETWKKVKKSLADNQSDDTVNAVKRRVG